MVIPQKANPTSVFSSFQWSRTRIFVSNTLLAGLVISMHIIETHDAAMTLQMKTK
jgi:hypothetical protein